MSYNIALSGLNAAQSDLGVISHNIANASTVGFKESRAEFADIFATSTFGSGSTAIGSGVLLSNVSQQFHQGNLEFTDNTLDLAISGEGFFALTPDLTNRDVAYSRAGQFGVDSDGYVVNSSGYYLQVFPPNSDGTVSSTALASTQPLQLPSSTGEPSPTSAVDLAVNLDPEKPIVDRTTTAFDRDDSNSYSSSTSLTVYDSQGNAHIATTYFTKTNTNEWEVRYYLDNQAVNLDDTVGGTTPAVGTMTFDSSGYLDNITIGGTTLSAAGGDDPAITTAAIALGNGADDLVMEFDFGVFGAPAAGTNPNSVTTQHAGPFQLKSIDQNGYTTGRLSGLEIADDGMVRANYTNGQSIALGKVALVDFANPQGLNQLGNTMWSESVDSGEPVAGEAGSGKFGLIKSGALEASNVDLTEELVSLITAQRNFQANAKSIETNNTLTQTIINLR